MRHTCSEASWLGGLAPERSRCQLCTCDHLIARWHEAAALTATERARRFTVRMLAQQETTSETRENVRAWSATAALLPAFLRAFPVQTSPAVGRSKRNRHSCNTQSSDVLLDVSEHRVCAVCTRLVLLVQPTGGVIDERTSSGLTYGSSRGANLERSACNTSETVSSSRRPQTLTSSRMRLQSSQLWLS